MIQRRKFLKQTSALALGLLASRFANAQSLLNPMATTPVGLQLYTLGDLMTTDPKGTLQKLAAIGYKELETAGSQKGNYYGYTPKEFAAMAKDLGLHWRSAHVGGVAFTMDQIMKTAKTAADSTRIQKMAERFKAMPKMLNFKDNYQQLADDAAAGGVTYMVCSSIPVNTLDEIKMAVEIFNKAGEACKKAGVQFAYHNHQTEFDEIEGQRPFDYILSNTDKEMVKMELDLAWATKANQDPVTLFKQHPGRFPLWHVKDLDKVNKNPAEVGSGIVDFKRIFANSKESGMRYFFVEQDQAPKPLQNVTNSYNYLNKLLIGKA